MVEKLEEVKEELIKSYVEDNVRIRDLAIKYQVPRTTISYFLHKQGIETPRKKYTDRAENARKLARRYREEHPEYIEAAKQRAAQWRRDNKERALWKSAQQRAATKGLAFDITPEDIIIPEYCPLLGVKLEMGTKWNHFNSPSLDRKDSTKGYIKGNIWVISYRANVMKQNATFEELRTYINNLNSKLLCQARKC